MSTISVTETINAPRERVFAIASDIPNAAGFVRGIEKIEVLSEAPPSPDNLGPVGKGFAWRETRVMFGKKATETMSITGWNPPVAYTAEAHSHGAHYLSLFTFTETEPGVTRVTMSFSATPETFMARVMMKIFSAMTKHLVKCLANDLRDIKAAAEVQSPPPEASPD